MKYTVEYLDAGRITHAWQSPRVPHAGVMYARARVGDRYVMRWLPKRAVFKVFRLRSLPSGWASGSQRGALLGKPVFEHEDRDACIMWTAMKGDG